MRLNRFLQPFASVFIDIVTLRQRRVLVDVIRVGRERLALHTAQHFQGFSVPPTLSPQTPHHQANLANPHIYSKAAYGPPNVGGGGALFVGFRGSGVGFFFE